VVFLLDDLGLAAGGIGHGGLGDVGDFLVRPVDAGDVGAIVEAERGVIAQEHGEIVGVRRVEQQ